MATKYDELEKDALVEEIKKRRTDGRIIKIDLRSDESKLRAALEEDDEMQELEGADETNPEKLSKQAQARADGVTTREVPGDLGDFKGQYKYRPTGEVFGLKVLNDEEVRAHRTHQAKSPLKFWDGTEEEFRALFDKL